MSRKSWLIALATSVAFIATTALALEVKDVIKARHDYFHGVGHAMKDLGAELDKASPSLEAIQKLTAFLDSEAPKLPSQFPQGSGPSSGLKTEAKADIWVKGDEFKKDASDMVSAAHKLNQAAVSKDLIAIKAAKMEFGNSCKTCHQAFKSKDH